MSKLLHNLFFSVEFKQKGALVFRLAMLLSHLLPSPGFLLLYLLYFININRGNIMYIPISYHFGIKIHCVNYCCAWLFFRSTSYIVQKACLTITKHYV